MWRLHRCYWWRPSFCSLLVFCKDAEEGKIYRPPVLRSIRDHIRTEDLVSQPLSNIIFFKHQFNEKQQQKWIPYHRILDNFMHSMHTLKSIENQTKKKLNSQTIEPTGSKLIISQHLHSVRLSAIFFAKKKR